MRTAQAIEESREKKAESVKTEKTQKYPRGKHPNTINNLKMWKPGECGNPGGRPKLDMAAVISRAIFENNPQLIYEAFGKAMKKGNAYAFQVVADRAYGKMTDKIEVSAGPEIMEALAAGRKRAKERNSGSR